MGFPIYRPFAAILLAILNFRFVFGGSFYEQKVDSFITQEKCQEAVLNCTTHYDIIPFIAPVGLCAEYFPIECMTELVVSSHCMDEPGYGAFLMDIALEIEDCVKSGMKWTVVFLKRLIRRAISHILCHRIQEVCYNTTQWNPLNGSCDLNFPSCIMSTYAEEYCKEFEDDLELEFYRCLSGAMRCLNKKEVISECEKQYFIASRRIINEIDQYREYARKNATHQKSIKASF